MYKYQKSFPVGLNDGESITIDEFTFHGVPAKHNEIERDEERQLQIYGLCNSFWKMENLS